jgi:cell wall assembly regulator SMI1
LLVGSVHIWQQPEMAELLARLDAVAAEHQLTFAPGAQREELVRLGDVPSDLRALYAFANGSHGAIYYRFELASIAWALETSASLTKLAQAQFGPAYWEPSFVPFLAKMTGDHLYVDVAGVHGSPGSVIDFDHERPDQRRVLFDSVTQWLECLVEGLEDGHYERADEGIFPQDFLDTGDLTAIRLHEQAYTNGAYPWIRRIHVVNDAD